MKKLFKNKRMMLTVIIAALCILAIGLLLVLLTDGLNRREENKKLVLYETESQPYQLEKQNLLIEYANVEKYYLDSIADGSYIGIVFTELDYQLYNDVFPMFTHKSNGTLRSERVAGIMALYDGNMPGDEGLISRLSFDIMTDAGWMYVLYWDGEGELEEYVPRMRERFEELELMFPNVIMFASGAYSTKYDNYLHSQGLVHAIHHGEEGLPIIDKTADGKVWHPGIIGWNTRGLSNVMLSEIVNKGGIALFEVNFTDTTGYFLFDRNFQNRVDAFGRMIDTIERLMLEDDVEVKDFDNAKLGRVKYLSAREEVLKDIEGRKAEILEEINELDKIINEIYLKYYFE